MESSGTNQTEQNNGAAVAGASGAAMSPFAPVDTPALDPMTMNMGAGGAAGSADKVEGVATEAKPAEVPTDVKGAEEGRLMKAWRSRRRRNRQRRMRRRQ